MRVLRIGYWVLGIGGLCVTEWRPEMPLRRSGLDVDWFGQDEQDWRDLTRGISNRMANRDFISVIAESERDWRSML